MNEFKFEKEKMYNNIFLLISFFLNIIDIYYPNNKWIVFLRGMILVLRVILTFKHYLKSNVGLALDLVEYIFQVFTLLEIDIILLLKIKLFLLKLKALLMSLLI